VLNKSALVPTCTAIPATNGTTVLQTSNRIDTVTPTKLKLLQAASAYDRGAIAPASAKTTFIDIVSSLESVYPANLNAGATVVRMTLSVTRRCTLSQCMLPEVRHHSDYELFSRYLYFFHGHA
jgi:hypothetical protein